MLYELVGITRVIRTSPNEDVKAEINPMGIKFLPKIMTKTQEKHYKGNHFMLLFDSSPTVQSEILRTLRNDPRVVRANVFKVTHSKGALDIASCFSRTDS
ncbi:Hypothetical protein PAS_c131_0014 [Komagataella phaffii GS115]|uniref:Uncharacterized protein n=2 Tax=Komagataella phaffii TaxID=460519 RepID=C4R392_KOMPG|nr:Hypothetical protein PAS_c131_0014 [Komagataella phaffii GS115]CAY71226.1 Hypothetical protein PAS_c131_0014 [Komagataella phaffii GS115]